jgi:hypothetical protein
MFRYGMIAFLIAVVATASAAADPTGRYKVTLTDPVTGARSEGTVTVSRSSETYRVVWNIDGKTASGVALGGAFSRGDLVFGPAHPDDMLLAIGYLNGTEYGNATMIMQPDGSYSGYRVTSSSGRAEQEHWQPIQ